MMSVKELFYGTQTTSTPTWILSTAGPGPLSYSNGMAPYYGAYSPYVNNYAPSNSRYDDHDTPSRRNGRDSYTNSTNGSYDHAYRDSQRQRSSTGDGEFTSKQQQQHAGGQHGQHNRQNASSNWNQNSSSQIHNAAQQRGRDRTSNNHDLHSGGEWNLRRPSKVVELKVPLCCEACEERVSGSLFNLEGVESVQCDQYKQRVVVRGSAPPATVLKACKKLFKRSEIIDGSRKDNTSNYSDKIR